MEPLDRPWLASVQSFTRLIESAALLSHKVSAFCVFFMVIPVCLDVLLRLFFSMSIPGAIEMQELLMLLIVFFGMSGPQVKEGHIMVDLVLERFKEQYRHLIMLSHWTTCMLYAAVLAGYILHGAYEKCFSFETTPELLVSLWPFVLAAGICTLMLLLAVARNFLLEFVWCALHRRYGGMCAAFAFSAALVCLPWFFKHIGLAYDFFTVGLIYVGLLMALLLFRMPIGFAMAVVGLLGMITINPNALSALNILSISPVHSAMSFVLAVVPMFVLMGEIALYAGISRELFSAAHVWFGRLPGGLAIAGVAGCTGFAAICGDSLATGMTMTSVALPEMKKHKYNEPLCCAALAAGGTLGILIPPSLGFIFYAIITEESVGKLFLAGIFPGLLLASLFCLLIYFMARRWPHLAPAGERCDWNVKIRALAGVLPMLGIVLVVLGGMLGGIFSPTEGGAVGAAVTLVYSLSRKTLSLENFRKACMSTANITAKLLFMFIGVHLLGFFLASTRLPFDLADFVLGVGTNKYLILLCVVLLYLFLGCMLNVIPMILLTMPAIFPTIQSLGFDPVWFGVVTVILMEMGQITPPIGVVVFAIAGMPNTPPMAQIFKFVWPFVAIMLLTILIITIFPGIATFLPNALI